MSNSEKLLTPLGRIVQGSLYDPQTTDAEGNPLVYKTGINKGQPRTNYYFALAIAKGSERHWAETPWGAIIWAVGHAAFPNGQTNSPHFAWKVVDGDSTAPNRKGKKPCDREGYPRHWVLNFSSSFASSIHNSDGSQQLLEPNHVKLGDYIQVYGSVSGNDAEQQPGMFLNHSMIAFAGYGERIILGADPTSVGFGGTPLPPGASAVPLQGGFNPAPTSLPPPSTPPAPTQQAAYMAPPAPAMAVPPPYPGILTPPTTPMVPPAPPAPPAAPSHKMTALANGATYEQLIAAGWTHALLIQHGYIVL